MRFSHSRWLLRVISLTMLMSVLLLSWVTKTSAVTGSDSTWDSTLGWDFEDHTYDHPHLTQLSESQIRWQLEQVNAAFTAHGYPVPQHIDYPYGDYNPFVASIVSQYRRSGRLSGGTATLQDMNAYPLSTWYEIKGAEIRRTTSWTTIKGLVDACITNKALLVFNNHDVSSDQTAYQPPYGCTPEILTQLLDYLVQKQNTGLLTVMTLSQAYDSWSAANYQANATVVITFADGHKTDYTVVYPLFKARGLKGTSFIQVNLIGLSSRLTWSDIAEMRTPQTTIPEFPTIIGNIGFLSILMGITLILKRKKRLFNTHSP